MITEPEHFAIVCVCTGNVCRSPAAERLLRRALEPTVTVTSLGTSALVGQPVSPPMDALINAAGGNAAGFTAREITEHLLLEADLILAMTRQHRRAIVELAPATVRRCFTLREYARLLGQLDAGLLPEGSPAVRARAFLRPAAAQRRIAAIEDDDVADPYRRGEAAYVAAFDQIERAVDQIARVLAPTKVIEHGAPSTSTRR